MNYRINFMNSKCFTEVKVFTYFTTIVPTMTEDSDCVVCVVEDIKSVACVLSSHVKL